MAEQKNELKGFADGIDKRYERDESWMTARFWIQSTGRMELPLTEQGKTAGEKGWNVSSEMPVCHPS